MSQEPIICDETEFDLTLDHFNKICTKAMDYIQSYSSDNESVLLNYTLKANHINRVIGYSQVISRNLEMEEQSVLIAEIIALLHDIGRFEQFKQYETFNDNESVDHAVLAIEVIDKSDLLSGIPEDVIEIIKTAILNHNKIAIPKTVEGVALTFCKIIRDADKLDILDMAVKEYSPQNKNRNKSFTLDLENSPKISAAITKSILSGKLPDKKDLKTIMDFKLMQLGYVYDINYKASFSHINKMQYIKQLFETLPKTDQVYEMYRKVKIHVENQLI